MIARIIQLNNNFFSTDNKRELGEYSAFGYYDAIKVMPPQEIPLYEKEGLWKLGADEHAKSLDGTCQRKNTLCLTDKKEADRSFWENAKSCPYLYISLLRVDLAKINERGEVFQNNIESKCKETRTADIVMFSMMYYTNCYTEIMLVIASNSFCACEEVICSILKNEEILKTYSIFAVHEDVISAIEYKGLPINEDVKVNLKMVCKVDDEELIQTFMEKVANSTGAVWRGHRVLGKTDWTYSTDKVSLGKLLPLYGSRGKTGLLTHGEYKDLFYNIESEIMCQ